MNKVNTNTTSKDIDTDNLEKLKSIFPQFVKENKIDFDLLKKFFEDINLLETEKEKYNLSWAGKSNAFKALRTPSTGTLVRDGKGVNEDKSENIFIEGDNLEVLKLLQKHYFNQIKMIYIDPPYNTGKDFVYKDNFTEGVESYYERTGQTEDGIKMTANTEKNGRFHSDWLTMMYPRLFLARNLLRDDGVIFVSIDDNEVANLRLIMDEIFGEDNFVAQMIWKNKSGGGGDVENIVIDHEYVMVYRKTSKFKMLLDNMISVTTSYNQEDENGKYSLDRLDKQSLGYVESLDFPIIGNDGKEYKVIHKNSEKKVARWRWSKESVKERYSELVFKDGFVYTKNYEKDAVKPRSLMVEENYGRTRTGKTELFSIFGFNIFDYSKPTKLLYHILNISTSKDDIVLDFFAGSGTTAHAVMDLNAEDGGNRKWICVQLPEITDENSEAYKAGYKAISEISRERIKRAGKKVEEKVKDKLNDENVFDFGFKTFSLQKSNYRKWNILTEENDAKEALAQAKLFIEKPLVDDFREVDVVNEILLKEGFDLNAKIEKRDDLYIVSEKWNDGENEEGKRIFISFAKKLTQEYVESLKLKENDIFVCFDSALTDTIKVNIVRSVNLKVI